MKLINLKEALNGLSDEQLEQTAYVYDGDSEAASEINEVEISQEDFYWEHHGDLIGNLEMAKAQCAEEGEEWDSYVADLIVIPKGTITIHTN